MSLSCLESEKIERRNIKDRNLAPRPSCVTFPSAEYLELTEEHGMGRHQKRSVGRHVEQARETLTPAATWLMCRQAAVMGPRG